jgi:hypothetical protein
LQRGTPGLEEKAKRSEGNGEDLQTGCSGSRRGGCPCPRGRKRKIPRAILGKGEFLSEELKKFLQKEKELPGLEQGQLTRTTESSLET